MNVHMEFITADEILVVVRVADPKDGALCTVLHESYGTLDEALEAVEPIRKTYFGNRTGE